VLYRPSSLPPQLTIIRAEPSGSDRCVAEGIEVRAGAPLLAVCRLLVEAGHDPALALEAYGDGMLCLRVRAIGAAARLEINGDGTGFRRRRAPDAGPPMAPNGSAYTAHGPGRGAAP
jgi:hypothetical protein